MGGVSYSRDVHSSNSSAGFSSGGTSSNHAKNAMGRGDAHPDTSAINRTIVSETPSPVVIAFDVTGSNIEFARIVYDKAPMMYGQIEQQGYLPQFDISFAAVGDANCDSAALQVCGFGAGLTLDEWLKKLWLESGGGGQEQETYEAAAYYFAHFCRMPQAKLPFLFLIADEAPYPFLAGDVAQKTMGVLLSGSIPVQQVFSALFETFQGNVFILLNPYRGAHDSPTSQSIYKQWVAAIGENRREQIVHVRDEKSIVDLILGIIAMVSRTRDLAGYLKDMTGRGQTQPRIDQVASALQNLSKALVHVVPGSNLPAVQPQRKRNSGSKRF